MAAQSLQELNEFIRRFVALNMPEAVWVQAEIAEADERRGHYFLSLVEKAGDSDEIVARSEAVLWARQAKLWQRGQLIRLEEILRPGQFVQLLARVDFHERYGLKLIIEDIEPEYTIGQLALRRQATIEKLRSSGLFDCNRQLELPLVPQRLAVISSPDAAGWHDFSEQVRSNTYGYHFQIELFAAAMQGAQVSPEIRRHLRTLNRRHEAYDAIVIIRGGGARLDLADFDEADLCEAAAQARLPILTGIGHETDQSVLDMVAHTALKTPTAAAEFIINHVLRFEQEALLTADAIQQWIRGSLEKHRFQLSRLSDQVHRQCQQQLQQASWLLDKLEVRTEALNPEAVLRRGFVWLSKDNKAVARASDLQPGDEITAHFQDGERQLHVPSNPKDAS